MARTSSSPVPLATCSVLAELISSTSSAIQEAKLHAIVRTEEQVQSLSKLGVNVIQSDLNDATAIEEAILQNEIDIIVHTATSLVPQIAVNLIEGAWQTSPKGGWPYGEVKDTDPLYEREKELGYHPVRQTNIAVIEEAKKHDVKSQNVVIPTIYGRGSGQWKKLSVNIPTYISTSIKHKVVYKFDVDGSPPAAHISDLAALYAIIVERILRQEDIPMNKNGYYFAMVHRAPWGEIMQRIANGLYELGIVLEPKVQIWPSDEMAAEYLGFPALYVRAMCTTTGELVPVNAYRLGWQPKWTQDKLLDSIDDEIQNVLELDKGPTTLFDTLIPKK